ncbi:MAG: MgtC/SapB family protein [Chloroflexi bacterium]|nr:MgtC/SapB family protein [Chloroflexota bacterium]MCI0643634.1 MgtC/SapB family protein [Chloroflexota bacterium]MCI0729825.1 MgtC/SapB family protein [Chloroflexota bacterium]
MNELEFLFAVRIVVAALLGALVGLEREMHGRDAGLRTYAAVSLGACAFGLISANAAGVTDTTRIAAQVVTGIGFLGGGVILRGQNHVHGLTTAATLWVSAAVGLAVAYGMYLLGAVAAGTSLLLLLLHHLPVLAQRHLDGDCPSPVLENKEAARP